MNPIQWGFTSWFFHTENRVYAHLIHRFSTDLCTEKALFGRFPRARARWYTATQYDSLITTTTIWHALCAFFLTSSQSIQNYGDGRARWYKVSF